MSALRVNWWILGGGLGILMGFVGLMAVGFTQDPRALDTSVLTGRPAPDFSLRTLDGDEVTLTDLRGRPVVINFWSTWCVPCKVEHPLLQQAPALYPEVAFVGVVYQDDPKVVQRFLQREPLPYPQLVDPDGKVAIAFGVTGVPESFFIDASGVIRHKTAAPLSPDLLSAQLAGLLR